MGSYGQYCPIAKGAEIFAERWTPLIIRELAMGSHHFNDLERGLPGISRSLLSRRLRLLERAGIVERRAGLGPGRGIEYNLTTAGRDLVQVVEALGQWGVRWAFTDPRPEELDPVLLLWWVRGRIHRELLPPRKVIVRFDFRGRRTRPLWLVLEQPAVSLCMQDPGFDTDLVVTADLAAFYRVWLGRISFHEAVQEGLVELDGAPALARAFPRWLQLSHLAGAVRAAAAPTNQRRTEERSAGASRGIGRRRGVAASPSHAPPLPKNASRARPTGSKSVKEVLSAADLDAAVAGLVVASDHRNHLVATPDITV